MLGNSKQWRTADVQFAAGYYVINIDRGSWRGEARGSSIDMSVLVTGHHARLGSQYLTASLQFRHTKSGSCLRLAD